MKSKHRRAIEMANEIINIIYENTDVRHDQITKLRDTIAEYIESQL